MRAASSRVAFSSNFLHSFYMRLDLGVDERCAVLACRSVHPGDLNPRRAHQVEDISSITKKGNRRRTVGDNATKRLLST